MALYKFLTSVISEWENYERKENFLALFNGMGQDFVSHKFYVQHNLTMKGFVLRQSMFLLKVLFKTGQ